MEGHLIYLTVILAIAIISIIVIRKYNRLKNNVIIELNKEKSQNIQLYESRRYGKRIQQFMENQNFKKFSDLVPSAFITKFSVRSVSGDFYWMNTSGDIAYIFLGDCTGHGVPGAMLSMLCMTHISRLFETIKNQGPGKMLDCLHLEVQKQFSNKGTGENLDDGMDAAYCMVDVKKNVLQYAGARRPIIYFKNGKMNVLAATKRSVGGFQVNKERKFQSHKVHLSSGDRFYMYTDGFTDQFGGPEDKKFLPTRLRSLLKSVQDMPFEAQGNYMRDYVLDWKNQKDKSQTDDMLIIGVEV